VQTADTSLLATVFTVGIWAVVLAVEAGFVWLFVWMFYSQGGRSLDRARAAAIALALLGIILTPTGAYMAWYTVISPNPAWAQPTQTSRVKNASVESAAPRGASFNLGRASADQGKRLFGEMNCIACHRVQGKGGSIAPDLWGVGNRRDPEWIFKHFRDPQSMTPGTQMPRFPLADNEFMDLTAYLLALRDNP